MALAALLRGPRSGVPVGLIMLLASSAVGQHTSLTSSSAFLYDLSGQRLPNYTVAPEADKTRMLPPTQLHSVLRRRLQDPSPPAPCYTSLGFSNKTMDIWNLGGRGHNCLANAGDCLNENPLLCGCDSWDKPGCEVPGTTTANDGTLCSDTVPSGGTPRAVASDPPILRIKDVGIAGSMAAAPGQSFDLIVSNLTHYEPWSFRWTALVDEFVQIMMGAPDNASDASVSTTFEFCAVQSHRSYADFLANGPLTLDEFPLTFYDLCAPTPPLNQMRPRARLY